MRATLIVSVDEPREVAAAEAWFARWRPHLRYCSENTGCGCCVHIWDVEAPAGAVADLPEVSSARSDRADPPSPGRGSRRSGRPG